MTVTEREVAERLQTYAAELPVTPVDIEHARDELRRRLEHRAHHRIRMAALAVAASVAAVVAGGGALALRDGTDRPAPSPATTPSEPGLRVPDGKYPTVERLTGTWKIGNVAALVHFGADGTYAFDGRLADPVPVRGTYRVRGTTISLGTVGAFPCSALAAGSWLGGVRDGGRLDIVHSQAVVDVCPAGVGTRASLTRVSPQSPAGARMRGNPAGARLLVPAERLRIHGIWLQEGTGRLLRLLPEGTYAIDDGGELDTAPDDIGTYGLGGSGVLRLTSDADSRDCRPRDRSSWQRVRITDSSLLVGGADDTCQGRADLAGPWVRLS